MLAGDDTVKSAGVAYLPRLDSQTDTDYAAYKSRACFFNATARTCDGFVGLIFRRDPTVKLPDRVSGVAGALRVFTDDVDLMGTSILTYAKGVVGEVVGLGRCGTLVDWEGEGEQRAYVVRYTAEQIINWQTSRVNGRNVVTLVALSETITTPSNDGFEGKALEQIRVLRLVQAEPATGNGDWHYTVEVWRKRLMRQIAFGLWQRSSPKWELVETRVPLRLGKPLPLIPFVFHGPRFSTPDVDKLPLADIIAVNLDHFRLDADYKHGLHFTALPTAWVAGFDKESELRIGSSTAWVTDTVGAVAGFLEFKGQGLSAFEQAMDRDERLMAILGSKMLEPTKRVGETVEAIELRQSGENSVLQALALSVSDSISQVLRWVYWWNSTEPYPEDVDEKLVLLQLNTDFGAKGMSSLELAAAVAAWQAGAISRETMFDLFRKGEVLPPGRTDAEEKRLVGEIGRENSTGVFPNGSTTPGGGTKTAEATDETQMKHG